MNNAIIYNNKQSRQLLYKHAAIEAAHIAARKQARYDHMWLYGVRDITENLLLQWHTTARQQAIAKLQCIAETDRLRWLAQVTAINIAQVGYSMFNTMIALVLVVLALLQYKVLLTTDAVAHTTLAVHAA